LQIAERHRQGSFPLLIGRACSFKACSFKADQVEDTKNRRQVSGGHPTDAAMLCALILVHTVSVSRHRSSTFLSQCNFISISNAAKLFDENMEKLFGCAANRIQEFVVGLQDVQL